MAKPGEKGGGKHLLRLGLESVPDTGCPLPEVIKVAALSALRATTLGWEGVEDGFAMKALSGGFTNAVFRCSKPGGDNSTVLLRSYGQGTEVKNEASGLAGKAVGERQMFFSREGELKVSKFLGELGFGPALLATFEDGRVEEFLEGKALDAEEMHRPLISDLVARQVAELHTLDVDTGDRDPVIFRKLEDFHGKAMSICGRVFGGVDVVELGRMVAELRERLEEGVPSKTVFCHNDLQNGNIMYKGKPSASATSDTSGEAAVPNGETTASSPPRTSGRLLSLIDYEYAGYNPRGFDIGNHFCEWTADYAAEESHVVDLERYPSMEERRRYCRAYLGTINGVPDDEVSAGEVEGLVSEADAYSLASHLLWAIWSLLQSKSETAAAGFDYIKYAAERIRAYRHFSVTFLPSLPK